MNQNQKDKLKNMFLEHKKIIVLLIAMNFLIIILGFTSTIPKNKLNKELETNKILNNQKNISTQKNKELNLNLDKEEETKTKLDNQNQITINNQFEVVSGSKWKGVYSANQGETELILEINEHNAIFNFGPSSKNQDVEKGSYYMGKNVINSTTGFVDLVYTEWKEKPYGYEMLNLSGVAKGNYMTGILTDSKNNKVGNFKLTKLN